MTPSNGNIFRVAGLSCGDFTRHRWIPRMQASDAELLYFLWSAHEPTVEQWCRWFETPSRSLWRHCNGKQHINYNLVRRQRTKVIHCNILAYEYVSDMFITSPVLYVDNVMQASIFKPWQARYLLQHELAINKWHVIHQCHSLSR